MRPVYPLTLTFLIFVGSAAVKAQDHEPDRLANLIDGYLEEKDYSKRLDLEERIVAEGAEAEELVSRRLSAGGSASEDRLLVSLLSEFRLETTAARLEQVARAAKDASTRSMALSGLKHQRSAPLVSRQAPAHRRFRDPAIPSRRMTVRAQPRIGRREKPLAILRLFREIRVWKTSRLGERAWNTHSGVDADR